MVAISIGQVTPGPIASAVTRGLTNRASSGTGFRRGLVSSVWEQSFDIYVALLMSMATIAAVTFNPALFAPVAIASATTPKLTNDFAISSWRTGRC